MVEWGIDIAVDGAGNAYVTGKTSSADFPTRNPPYPNLRGTTDAFITKLNASGTGLVYSTYLGGSGDDEGGDIAVDSAGNAYLTGVTYSADFPTRNALYMTFAGLGDAFIVKLNASGTALMYSTYLGGSYYDTGSGIAVDGAGNAYVTGGTNSANFPIHNAPYPNLRGFIDGFIAKLNASGTVLVYSTYLGGSGDDGCNGIAVDGIGNAYVTGWTRSADFPTRNAPYPNLVGSPDAFIAKLNSSGTALVYATYLGGSNEDWGNGIAVDGIGNAYVTGYTWSADFPTRNAPYPNHGGGYADAFITKFNSSGTSLVYSTYLGGSNQELGGGIAVDGAGNAYVTGYTNSANFPTRNAPYPNYRGNGDAFIVKIANNDDHGNSISQATKIGVDSRTAGRIDYTGDNDYFRLQIGTAGTLTVYTLGTTDTYGYLLNSQGMELARNDDTSSTNPNFRITPAIPGLLKGL